MTASWPGPARDDSDATVRISGPGDLLDALPRMLGYLPSESAVLVALRPPRGRIALTMRVDLPQRPQEPSCARLLARHAARAGATSALLVVYDDRPDSRGVGWRGASLARAMRAELRAHGGLRLADALSVRDGRWRSLLCADEGCCPDNGQRLRAVDEPSAATVALVAEGATVLESRDDLVARLAAPVEPRLGQCLALHEQAAQDVARHLDEGGSVDALRAETVALIHDAAARAVRGSVISDAEAARLVVGLLDVLARDAVLAMAGRDDTDGLFALLLDLAPRAVEPFDAPVLTALAWVAYARGDGTLANIAVERALASDPAYSLAQLVADALRDGLHPSHVRQVSRLTELAP